jgi:glycosyltransferase involved in cell wall biosynthesis
VTALTVYARLHLYPPDHAAGAEMMVHSMFRALIARGHRVVVWLTRESVTVAPYVLDGVSVYPVGSEVPDWDACDVVVSHLENVPSAARAALVHGKRFVNVVHNDRDMTRLWLHGHTDLVVYNSEWMAESLGRGPGRIIVRPPVIADDYRTTPGSRVTLVNLNAEKGGQLFAELARRMPDVDFLAVEGAYGDQVHPTGPNVRFLPHGQDMRAVYAQTRLLLMPSAYESWGRVGVEAMLSGIPVLAHPTPGLCESLSFAGIFLDRADPDSWVDAIRRLQDPDTYAVASGRALARAAELDPTEDLTRWCDAVEALCCSPAI